MSNQHPNVYTREIDALIVRRRLPSTHIGALIGKTSNAIRQRRRKLLAGRATPPVEVLPEQGLLLEEIEQLEIANDLDRERIATRERWIAQKRRRMGG